MYVDCGLHPEICTPECANPWDAVRYIQAGHRTLAGLAAAIESASTPGTEILCFRGNVDYSGTQATWGCHESYLHRIPLDALQPQVIPHLVTRLIYTGAGGFNPLSNGLEFTLSPRVAHIELVVSRSSTNERGIWHTKSESLCSGYSRLHVLCGESLCSETATFLKIGATALMCPSASKVFPHIWMGFVDSHPCRKVRVKDGAPGPP
jgi:proteasome accessory factor A